MFTNKRKVILGSFSIGVLFFSMSFLFFAPLSAEVNAKGHAIVCLSHPFQMKGGDPHTARGSASYCIVPSFNAGLVKEIPGKRDKQPALAKSWELSPDFKILRITLVKGAKFHNGAPVKAEDVKFSYERAMKPELKYIFAKRLRKLINKIEILDDYNIVFHLKEPYPLFLDQFGHKLAIIPKAYAEKVGDDEFAKRPIGAGPFKWVDGQQDTFIRLEAWEGYFGKVPYVKTLELKFKVDNTTAFAMLKAGEADIVFVTEPHIEEVEKDPDLRLMWSKHTFLFSMIVTDLANPENPSPWHDVRVREALAYAINSDAICKKVLKGTCEPYGDIIAPYQIGYDPSVKPYPYDPKRAKKLLAEAGYPDGFETTMTAYPVFQLMSQAVQENLRKVGIESKLEVVEGGTYIHQLFGKKLKGSLTLWSGPYWGGERIAPLSLTSTLSPASPWTYYITPELVAAYEEWIKMADEKSIATQARKVSKLFREQLPRVPLWSLHTVFGVGPRVESWERLPGYRVPNCLEYLKLKD